MMLRLMQTHVNGDKIIVLGNGLRLLPGFLVMQMKLSLKASRLETSVLLCSTLFKDPTISCLSNLWVRFLSFSHLICITKMKTFLP